MHEILASSFGYLASILLALSLLVTNDIRFRWLNSFGCAAFIVYGIMLNAFPIILTNTLLLGINIFYLVKIYTTHENFDLIEFQTNDLIVRKFLSFYNNDIHSYFPNYNIDESGDQLRFIVLRDLVIANVFAAHIDPDGTAFVKINYTLEKYRDFEVGTFIFEQEKKYLIEKGVKRIAYREIKNKNHERFIKIIGFEKVMTDGNEWYIKSLV